MRYLILIFFFLFIGWTNTAVGQVDMTTADSIYVVADESPYLPECFADSLSNAQLKKCSQNLLLQVFFMRLQYPQKARDKKKGGMSVCSFVINKDGTMSDLNMIKDPGFGMGQAALDALRSIHELIKWVPAKDDGQPVRFKYMMPARFQIGK